MAEDLAFAGLGAQAELLAAREVSSVELVEAALDRIEAAQPTLNAFRVVHRERALAEAAAADARLAETAVGKHERPSPGAAARAIPPLLGVPVAIKDDLDLAGESTPFGCQGEFRPAADDAEAVRRLRAGGAIIVGKTNTPEFGQWPVTEGPAFGATRNPWSLGHTPGGSSGGSAAAVAAGLVAAALGSDGLGSIRVPAAWTHLVGIKPQRGRVSGWPEADALNGLAVIGPLARTVADAARLLDAVTGSHDRDRTRLPPPGETFLSAAARKPPRLRIALSTKPPYAVFPTPLDPRVREAVERLGAVLESLGHEVEFADPAYGVLGIGVLPRAIAGVHGWAGAVPDPSLLDPRTRGNARLGALLRGPALWAGRALEPLMARQVGGIFDRCSVVLAPTTAQPPLPIGTLDGLSGLATDRRMLAACPFTWPWNVLGWPGVNVPAGLVPADRGADGDAGAELPVGAQLLGPAGSEALLISLAAELEEHERWADRRPPPLPARLPGPAPPQHSPLGRGAGPVDRVAR